MWSLEVMWFSAHLFISFTSFSSICRFSLNRFTSFSLVPQEFQLNALHFFLISFSGVSIWFYFLLHFALSRSFTHFVVTVFLPRSEFSDASPHEIIPLSDEPHTPVQTKLSLRCGDVCSGWVVALTWKRSGGWGVGVLPVFLRAQSPMHSVNMSRIGNLSVSWCVCRLCRCVSEYRSV